MASDETSLFFVGSARLVLRLICDLTLELCQHLFVQIA